MAKVNKTPKNDSDMWANDKFSAQFGEIGGPDPAFADQNKPDVDVDKLMERIAALETQTASLKGANDALMAQFDRPAPKIDPQPKGPTTLPDPMLDAEGYGRGLEERIVGRLDAQRAAERAQQEEARRLEQQSNQLWETFSTRYPEYKEFPDRVEFVASRVSEAAAKRGVDLRRYMLQTPDQYLADVATEYQKVFGEKKDPEPNRTGGVFGGLETGGRPSPSANPPEAGDMIADIHAMQRRTGFH